MRYVIISTADSVLLWLIYLISLHFSCFCISLILSYSYLFYSQKGVSFQFLLSHCFEWNKLLSVTLKRWSTYCVCSLQVRHLLFVQNCYIPSFDQFSCSEDFLCRLDGVLRREQLHWLQGCGAIPRGKQGGGNQQTGGKWEEISSLSRKG